MNRVVIRRWVNLIPQEGVGNRVFAACLAVRQEMDALAATHLEESPLAAWCWQPDATGKHRCLVSGVMNTERGLKLIARTP